MTPSFSFRLLASTAAIALFTASDPASAQSPQAPTVAAGSIAINRQGATTVVNQTTDRGIIDWRSFSIGAGEAVRFDQPGRSSVTLNRVTGSELSRIDGNLSANGQVWLANPNGVMIGPGGQVNVGGLLATTGRVDSAEFLKSGRAAIDQIGKDSGIVNHGTVNIAEGGYAALAAASIRNEGVVAARKGSVALGAGKAVTVDFAGDKLITFQVTNSLDQAVPGDVMISVGGKIAAEGGTVLMSARAAKGVMDNVINLKGHVVANSVRVDGGTVTFGDGGIVQVSGKIDASNTAGVGGGVTLLGEKVGLMDGASVDASGALGGGAVRVGGDWQGKGPTHTSTIAYVAPAASINVDATMAGDGGKAVVWADDTTRFNGTISARGGVLAGDGGQVETSGKRALHVSPAAQVTSKGRAPGAKAGTWMLDPTDITIVSGGGAVGLSGGSFTPTGESTTINVGVINAALNNGNSVTLQTASDGSGSGFIVFESGTIATNYAGAPLTLKLLAESDILFFPDAKIELSGAKHAVQLRTSPTATDQAGVLGGIGILGATITTTGGAITMDAGVGGALGAAGSATNAAILISTGSLIDAGSGTFFARGVARADQDFQQYGVLIDGAKIKGSGDVSITGKAGGAGGDNHGVSLSGSSIAVTGTGKITLDGTRGPQDGGWNVYLDSKSSISSDGGAVNIIGTAVTGGGASSYGIYTASGSTISTVDGLITLQGNAAKAGITDSDGVGIAGTVKATGKGVINITGARGGHGPGQPGYSENIVLLGTGLLQTDTGSITLTGTSSAGGGPFAVGVLLVDDAQIASGGAITLDGVGAAAGMENSSGVRIRARAKIAASGSEDILLKGAAGGGSGVGVHIDKGSVSIGSGVATLQTNSLSIGSPSTVTTTNGGSVNLRGYSDSSSIGVGFAAGDLAIDPAVLGALKADVVIGSADQTGQIRVADGTILLQNTSFRSASGAINFLGDVGGSSGLTSLTIENAAGTTSFGGAVGVNGALFTTVNVSGALRIDGAGVTTSGSQSYGGAVALASKATFATGGADVTFAGPVNGLDGKQSLSTSLLGGTLSLIGGVGQSKALESLQISDPVALGGAITTSGTQSYGGAVAIVADTKLDFSNLRFNSGVSGSGDLTIANGSIELGGGSISLGSGKLSFAGGAYLTSDLTIDAAATIFKAGVSSISASRGYSLTIKSGDLTLSSGSGSGTLASLAVSSGATTLGGMVSTSGAQNYGGTLTLSDDALLISTGGSPGGLIRFGGAISGPGKTLTLSTKGVTITLPTVTVANLSILTGDGAVTQSEGTKATVTANAYIDSGSGGVTLTNPGNSIAELALYTNGAANVALSGSTALSDSTVSSLSLSTTGDVRQSGPLIAKYLSLGGAGGSYQLTNSANRINGLVANTGSVTLTNGDATALQVVSTGVTVTDGLTLTQSGSGQTLTLNGPINLGSSTATLTADDTIAGGAAISGAGATLNLKPGTSGGSVNTSGTVMVNVLSADISVNGVLISSNPTPTKPSAETIASVPSVASVPTVAATPTQGSQASQVSQASQISQASTPSVATLPTLASTESVASIAAVASLAEATTTPSLIGSESVEALVARLIVNLDLAVPNANKSLSAQSQPSGQSAGSAGGGGADRKVTEFSAQRQLSLINATSVGALIPSTPTLVPATGAPLAAASTIKVDPADTGGANGQVIARSGADSAVGGVLGAPAQSGGPVTVVPGLLMQAPRNPPTQGEPPLAEQPSTINEEVFLD